MSIDWKTDQLGLWRELKMLGAAILFLDLAAFPAIAQGIKNDAVQLAADITSALVRPGGIPDYPSDSVMIEGCNITLEYNYADSCKVPDKLAKEIIAFDLNDLQEVSFSSRSSISPLKFVYRPALRSALENARSIVQAIRKNTPLTTDDHDLGKEIRDRVDALFEARSVTYRGSSTYCNGASIPMVYPTQNATIYVDREVAVSLANRLNSYIKSYCPMRERI